MTVVIGPDGPDIVVVVPPITIVPPITVVALPVTVVILL
jgi:hypothetical protein